MTVTTIGTGTVTAAVDSLGAQLVSLKKDGSEYLWQGDKRWWSGQAPILFPIVGSLRGDRATAAEGAIVLPRHGLARRREFQLDSATETELSLSLSSNDETLSIYPYNFTLTLTYTVTGDSVRQSFTVSNTGDTVMPFVVGGHPAFNVPVVGDSKTFADYRLVFSCPWSYATPTLEIETGLWDFGTLKPLLTDSDTLPLDHRFFDVDTVVFENVPDSTVSLLGPKGHGMRIDFEDFAYLGVWSAAGDAPFVALEPWVGPATAFDEDDIFEHKRGMQVLDPGASAQYTFSMTPL